MATIQSLERSRSGHRLQLVMHEGIADNHENNSKPITEAECEKFLNSLEKTHDKVITINDLLFALCTTDAETTTASKNACDFELQWIAIVNRLESIKRSFAKPPPQPTIPNIQNLKLPRVVPPTFDGQYENWPSFQDLFLATVDKQKDISDAQKLQYLKSSVTGEASQLIRSFTVTDAHYKEAWDLLTDRYDNTRDIVFSLIKKMLNQSPAKTESADHLRRILDVTTECLRSLKVLERPVDTWDDLVVFVVMEKLDSETRREWALSLRGTDPSTFKDLQEFLEQRIRGLHAGGVKSGSGNNNYSSSSQSSSNTQRNSNGESNSSNSSNSTNQCVFCSKTHTVFHCNYFKGLPVEERSSQARAKSLCINCLRPGHTPKNCPSKGSCQQCGRRHHSLLHFEKKGTTPKQDSISTCATIVTPPPQATFTLLMTAKVNLLDAGGRTHQARAFIDPGSEATIITEECAKALSLPRTFTKTDIRGAGSCKVGTSKSMISLTVSSLVCEATLEVQALVLPAVTATMPKLPCDPTLWNHLNGLTLADPTFHIPGKIDILLGADIYSSILRPGLKHGSKHSPSAQNTLLGWVLSGKVPASISNPLIQIHHLSTTTDDILEKFWKLEELPPTKFLTKEEEACEHHFQSTFSRDSNGRYVVQLPFNDKVNQLGFSRDQAMRRFLSLEKRFIKFPGHANEYRKFMEEYLSLGHMEIVPEAELICKNSFYLPHHFVLKDSSTTKLRVVFDGSAKSSTGLSLNDVLMVGPTIQDNLFTLIIRFRNHPIALKGDIAKMYRQFKVCREHANYQRILWRFSPNGPIVECALTTISYGVGSSAYQATRSLQQLAIDEAPDHPIASKVILKDFYVDDLMSGAATPEKAIELQQQLTQILKKGGMEIRKWMSNDKTVLQSIPNELKDSNELFDLDNEASVEALGVKWRPSSDCFTYTFKPPNHKSKLTKRILSSDLAKVFDPLGLISPVTINAKVMLQDLWKENIGWDEPVGHQIKASWTSYQSEMPKIESIQIPRYMSQSNSVLEELHGFSDGSCKAYSAVVYLKTTSDSGSVKITIVAAKAKVAPVKQVTIPRMELLGAELLTDLICNVRNACNLSCSVTAWTDSTLVLNWLAAFPGRWKTFVSNRVAKIQQEIPFEMWRHVRSEDNPADCASRGISTEELINHPIWWNGPSWLKSSSSYPPSYSPIGTQIEEKKQKISINFLSASEDSASKWSSLIDLVPKFSSLQKLRRVMAYVKRFIHNATKPESKLTGILSPQELKSSLLQVIKVVQKESFQTEINCLESKIAIKKKSKLIQLNPFLGGEGVLKVGGRIQHSDAPEERKHPILIPHESYLAWLLIHECHISNMHSGFQLTLASLSSDYWITKGRDTIRHIIRKCVPCRRQRAKVSQQLMGSLPSPRVTPNAPFLKSGVDYAGPYSILFNTGRGSKTFKCYFAVFVCFATKAVHLEAVTNLSSDAFLASFRRFAARRGRPSHMFSDCGTNFVGADNEMKELVESLKYNEEVANNLSNEGTTWHFNPPHAPHQGGLWESGVKAVKFHLRRVVGKVNLTLEEFGTLLCNVEAILNSRPLCAMSPDPGDLDVLTPGHFLIGRPINAIPDPDLEDIKVNRLSRWQHVQQLTQHFWKRWRSEYLSSLQQRFKWTQKRSNMEVGDLVLVHDDILPPTQWKMARVIHTHPGEDSLVRVVTLKTTTGEIKRPIAKLSPILPNNQIDSD